MILRNRLNDRNVMRTIGLVCLILASVWRWFVHPTGGFGSGLVDGTMGLLYGLSIGCLLLSLRRGQCARHEA